MSRPPNTEARERILDAAHDLIYRNGFKGVSMDAIAEAAGVKKANLFHYYPTKDALGLAVFDYAIRGFQERWAEKLKADGDPVDMVDELFAGTKSGMEQRGCCGGCFIGNLAQELSDSNEKFRQRFSDHFQSWQRLLSTYFARHQAAGTFGPGFDPQSAASAVLSLFEGALLFAKATRQTSPLENGRQMATQYLAMLKAK